MTERSFLRIMRIAAPLTAFAWLLTVSSLNAATTYNFSADSIGQTPSGVTVTAGTFDVQDEATLGKSMRAVTQAGVIAGVLFSNFTGSSDQSVSWRQAYSNNMGRGGFTLRAQDADTSVANSAGARMGYLFHVYDSGSVYIWRVGSSSYTALWSGSLAKAQPRWFKATAIGTQLTFSYSADNVSYTTLATVNDSAYVSGKVQYTAGYGAAVDRDYIDDVTITNLDVDTTAPTVSSLSPADNANGVSLSGNLVMGFSEAVDIKTGTIGIYKASDDSLVESIDVTGGQVSGTGTSIITIDPSVSLAERTAYYVLVDATAFDDAAGNSYTGILNTTTWNFTTGDFTKPNVVSLSPANGETNVSLITNLVLTHSELIEVGSGTVRIYDASDDSLVESVDVTGGQVSGDGTDTIVVTLSSPLARGKTYYVLVDATAFDDAAGNSEDGISDSLAWRFSTPAIPVSVSGYVSGGGRPILVSTSAAPSAPDVRSCVPEVISRTLRKGMAGEDVRALQRFLNCSGMAVATSGPGSAGNETTLFSSKTHDALVRYQEQHAAEILAPLRISKGTGVFGAMTKQKVYAQ